MNKEVYEKNLKAYILRYGEYPSFKVNKYEELIEDCKNGCKTLKVNIENKKVYLNSKYDPINEAKKYYKDYSKVNYGTIIIVFGFGLSYYISELYKKVEDRATILVYEQDIEMFDVVMKNVDISDILSNNNVHILFDIKYILNHIQNCDYKIEYIPVYKDLYLEDYLNFMKDIKHLLKEMFINFCTFNNFKDEWTKNNFSNIPYMLSSYKMSDFKDIFKNKPIVVVGAGPSLNKNISLLKEIKSKVCIISVFSAAKVLQNEGITPDFIATIDSKQYGITEFEANIPLLYIYFANTDLLRTHKKEKILSNRDEFFMEYILDKEIEKDDIVSGSTVTFFASECARYFGASEIILIGQDFSWTKDKIHAKGSVHKATKGYREYHHFEMPVEDMYGNTVYSNEPFMSYKRSFDSYTKMLPEGVKLIQATEGGLAIEGAETRTLQESIDIYCKDKFCNVDKVIQDSFKNNKVICDSDEDKEKVFQNIRNVYEGLIELKKSIQEAQELSKKLLKNIKYSNNKPNKNNNIIKKLDEIDKQIRESNTLKVLISFYSIDLMEYFVIDEQEDENLNFAIMNEKLYSILNEILEKIIKIIKEEMKYEN